MGNPICTCNHCLWYYLFAAIINQLMMALMVTTYILFGSAPPTFPMAIGFWLIFYTNYFGQYLSVVTISKFRKNLYVRWLNKMIEIGIAVTACLFFLGGLLFFIPLSPGGMMIFSKFYLGIYGKVPPFLDIMQSKFQCCGINNYLDYGADLPLHDYGDKGFFVTREANKNDDFFHEFVNNPELSRIVKRRTNGLDVPQSCCPFEKTDKQSEKDCGKKVEYRKAENGSSQYYKNLDSAKQKVNDPNMGCYQKLQNIFDNGAYFQLSFLIGIIQVMSFLQSILFWSLLWFHRRALKTILQTKDWIPELQLLHDDGETAVNFGNRKAEADTVHEANENGTLGNKLSLGASRLARIIMKKPKRKDSGKGNKNSTLPIIDELTEDNY